MEKQQKPNLIRLLHYHGYTIYFDISSNSDSFIDEENEFSNMKPVKTRSEVEEAARKAIENLYGHDFQDLKVREILPFISDQSVVGGGLPTEDRRDSWDVQVTFLLEGIQYTVDLVVIEKNGQITNARLIDKMTPI
jgi:hypothetical protein